MKLDIGCSVNKKIGYIGLDIKKDENVDIVVDAVNLPFKDNSIEEVYTRRTLQHIKKESKAIREMYRVLKSNGRLYIVLASIRGYLFYYITGIIKKHSYETMRFYTNKSLMKKLRKVGFKIIRTYHIKSKRRFGYDISCEAKKKL